MLAVSAVNVYVLQGELLSLSLAALASAQSATPASSGGGGGGVFFSPSLSSPAFASPV